MRRKAWVVAAVLLAAFSAQAHVPDGDLLAGVTPGPDGKIDVLTVFSHQDDESIYGGGALFKMKRDPRVRLYILCMTFDQTSGAKDALKITPDHIGNIRAQELKTAAAVYEAEEVIQFMYASRTLNRQDPEELIGRIKEVIDRVGAEIVLTHDPAGITGHWDHVTCSRVATAAFWRSGAERLYYPTLPMYLYRPLRAFQEYDTVGEPAAPTLRVDIRAEKKLKRMACAAHASQMVFTEVGTLTDFFLVLDHEYFALGGQK
ncbi:MAG TPA: PIG-L deacetylase family protein [bacterium]|nr:PIG-L deacetylase family protein [bacterium]